MSQTNDEKTESKTTACTTSVSQNSQKQDVIVQYVIVRKDLMGSLKWPMGATISQACHAVVAVISENLKDEVTMQYISPENLPNMHKVTLEVGNESQLLKVRQKFIDNQIIHKLWTEMPEKIPTAIALKPYWKSQVFQFVKHLKLFK